MLSRMEIVETNKMIKESNLDVRTITMGISLMDCADSDLKEFNRKIYDKITKTRKNRRRYCQTVRHTRCK